MCNLLQTPQVKKPQARPLNIESGPNQRILGSSLAGGMEGLVPTNVQVVALLELLPPSSCVAGIGDPKSSKASLIIRAIGL